MVRSAVIGFVIAALAFADGFTFSIGNPVASGDYRSKTALFVFRTEGCADPAKSQISGTAEGLIKGMRQSVTLNLTKLSQPGVYGVNKSWAADGAWVVSLSGTCGNAKAGAIIPIGPGGFIRDSSRFLPHSPTNAEIEASLKALTRTQGEKQ
jgi:hypothetical protein